MNSETFTQFLKTPAYLYRISYQELKSLVVQYPYCQNLRYLLLKKSQADQHPEYERNLQMAATYSVERSFLYEQLYSNDNIETNRESNVASESNTEVLELKDLEALDLTPQKEVLYAENEAEPTVEMPAPANSSNPLDLSIGVFEENDSEKEEIPVESVSDFDDLFSEASEEDTTIDEIEAGHQVSEEETSTIEKILPVILPEEETNHLEIIEDKIEDKASEITPEANSDDIEDLFSEPFEETPEVATEVVLDNTSLGLDSEDLNATATPFPVETPLEENLSPVVELEVKPESAHSEAVDLADLMPTEEVIGFKKNEEEEEELEIVTEMEDVLPQSSFSNWLKQFNSPQISVEVEDLDSKEKKKKVNYKYELVNGEWKQIKTKVKKKKKKSKAEQIAAESVKLSKDVATETLAQLLEKQEHYRKAIKMYERLSLEIPEKSDYFASKIKALLLKL